MAFVGAAMAAIGVSRMLLLHVGAAMAAIRRQPDALTELTRSKSTRVGCTAPAVGNFLPDFRNLETAPDVVCG
jgi:hypothetical protein